MDKMTLVRIGMAVVRDGEFAIALEPAYVPALAGLDKFGCAQILWWFDGCDDEESRSVVTVDAPYVHGPDALGTFATRSPERPNPIALSTAFITNVDQTRGMLYLSYLDARDGSPVLDIKPYTPSLDRVEKPVVPGWCAHWPGSVETSGDFDWADEFNF